MTAWDFPSPKSTFQWNTTVPINLPGFQQPLITIHQSLWICLNCGLHRASQERLTFCSNFQRVRRGQRPLGGPGLLLTYLKPSLHCSSEAEDLPDAPKAASPRSSETPKVMGTGRVMLRTWDPSVNNPQALSSGGHGGRRRRSQKLTTPQSTIRQEIKLEKEKKNKASLCFRTQLSLVLRCGWAGQDDPCWARLERVSNTIKTTLAVPRIPQGLTAPLSSVFFNCSYVVSPLC